MRRHLLLSLVLGLLASTLAGGAGAAMIRLVPSADPVAVGEHFEVGIFIDGLGDGVAPSLGLSSVVFEFDPTLVSFQRATLTDELGFSLDAVLEAPGEVQLFQSTMEDAAFLDAVQPASFELARVELQALRTGSAALGLSVLSLEEAGGADIPYQVSGATVGIRDGAAPVPEPSAALVFGAGLLLIGRHLRRHSPGSTIS
jgi:hypothetical protein